MAFDNFREADAFLPIRIKELVAQWTACGHEVDVVSVPDVCMEVHVDSRLLCTLTITITETLGDESCVIIETYNAECNGCKGSVVWVSPTRSYSNVA